MDEVKVKPGWKTTEFWMSSIAALLGIAYASGLIGADTGVDKVLGIVASTLAGLGYAVSRGLAKK